MDKKSKDTIRDSIDDLLSELPDEVPGLSTQTQMNLNKVVAGNTNAGQLAKAKAKASRVMKSLLGFYLSEEIIEEHEYIKAKAALDETALSMLIRQMQNSENAITILMDTINEGDVAPRMFEVLSDLQRTLLDIIKSQTMYMIAIEESAKKISRDIDVYSESSTKAKKKINGVKSRGTKDLMRALQDSIKDENIEDVDSNTHEE